MVHLKGIHSASAGHAPVHRAHEAQMAAILQLSQYCTFTRDSISTVITEPGQPVSHRGPSAALPSLHQLLNPCAPPEPHVTPNRHPRKDFGAFNRNGFASEVAVQKIIQIISVILMKTLASAMQLNMGFSSFFQPKPPVLDLREKGQPPTPQTPLSPP